MVAFGLLPSAGLAQSPPVVWSKSIAGPFQTSQFAGIALDQQDNFYFTASFTPQTIIIGNQTLTNRSAYAGTGVGGNGFVAKFSRTGDLLWAREIGGTRFDNANTCTADANGNVFVTGAFSSPNIDLNGVVLTNSPQNTNTASCFLAKYDPQGNLLWARQSSYGAATVSAGSQVNGTSVAVDADDNVWLAGTFNASNAIFGSNVLVNPEYSGPGSTIFQDFLVKYDNAGNVLWAKMAEVHGNDDSPLNGLPPNPCIGVDAGSNTFFCSDCIGIPELGTTPLTNFSANRQALLLAKFDPAGNVLWAGQAAYISSSGGAFPGGVAVDVQGNCRIGGTYWRGTAVFPSAVLPAPTQAEYDTSGFIARFDASGNFVWAAGPTSQYGGQASVDAIGNSYFTGGSGTFNAGGAISKYAGDGTLLWATNSIGFWGPMAGTTDPAGTLFIVGSGDPLADGFSAAQLSGPTLNIAPLAGQLVISWPTNEAGLFLESGADLSGPWMAMTNPPPAVAGNLYVVTNDVSAGSRYYRLKNF